MCIYDVQNSKVVVVQVKERIHVTTHPRLLILMQKFQRRVFGPCHVLSERPVVNASGISVGPCHMLSERPVVNASGISVGPCHMIGQRPVSE
jgi:hypothetical protein